MKEGDSNTSFFHKVSLGRKFRNLITPERVRLQENASLEDIARSVSSTFEARFKASDGVHVNNQSANFPKLSQEETSYMEVTFFEEEVYRELMGVDGSKVPSPDGFPFKFAQIFWPVFKEDLMALFNHFFESTKFDHRFLSLMISLIRSYVLLV